MSLTIALSVAELCSSYPTAGGMYVVTKYVVADRSNMPLAAWIVSTHSWKLRAVISDL